MNPVFILCIAGLILSSGIIVYQDLKERQVSLWVLLLFGIVTLSSILYFKGIIALLYNAAGTILYMGFIWGMLKLYLFLKYKKNTKIIDRQLGMADVLVILFIGITFNYIGMILFFCFGFVFSLVVFLIISLLHKKTSAQTIPLAGLLVFFFLICIIILNLIPLNYLIECSFVK